MIDEYTMKYLIIEAAQSLQRQVTKRRQRTMNAGVMMKPTTISDVLSWQVWKTRLRLCEISNRCPLPTDGPAKASLDRVRSMMYRAGKSEQFWDSVRRISALQRKLDPDTRAMSYVYNGEFRTPDRDWMKEYLEYDQDIPKGAVTLQELRDGTERALKRIAQWPQWKKDLHRVPSWPSCGPSSPESDTSSDPLPTSSTSR
jgi:hypothetical protein